jgi:hypothetical protein
VCDKDPSLGALNGFLPVLGQAAAFPKPRKSTLNNPSSRQNLKPFGGVGSPHDLDDPAANADQSVTQLWSSISSVGKHMAQLGGLALEPSEHVRRTVAVLNVGAMHPQRNQVAAGIGHYVALATLDPLARVKTANPSIF